MGHKRQETGGMFISPYALRILSYWRIFPIFPGMTKGDKAKMVRNWVAHSRQILPEKMEGGRKLSSIFPSSIYYYFPEKKIIFVFDCENSIIVTCYNVKKEKADGTLVVPEANYKRKKKKVKEY